MEQIKSKVEKQEVEISYIKSKLDGIERENKKQSDHLAKISESIQKQEIILLKVSNLEEKYYEQSKRVHDRIDETNEKFDKKIEEITEKIKTLKNAPCNNYSILEKEISYIKQEQSKFNKILWWITTSVIGSVMLGVLSLVIKHMPSDLPGQ